MILRRFMQHVKEQNWFAVSLDVIVVIVGIFLGLQVQAWYDDKNESEVARVYLQRLHSEVTDASIVAQRNFEIRREYHAKMAEVLAYATDQNTDFNLDITHCGSVIQSHIYFNPLASLATINEIISSGQMSILTDQNVVNSITSYTLLIERWNALIDSIRYDSVDLAHAFPDHITLNQSADITEARFLNTSRDCDFSSLLQNNTFKSNLFGNGNRYRNYVLQLELQVKTLQNLHSALDKALGIEHGVDNP